MLNEDAEFIRAYDSLTAHLQSAYYSQGTLTICDYGCGLTFELVVTGDERGKIWLDNRASDDGLYPILHPRTKQHLDFLSWYETWLDHSWRTLEGASPDQGHNPYWPWAPVVRSDGRYWPWG